MRAVGGSIEVRFAVGEVRVRDLRAEEIGGGEPRYPRTPSPTLLNI